MIRTGFIFLIYLLGFSQAGAQYFQFSQYNFAQQRVSPTAPAQSDYATLGFLYRNQGTASDIQLNSNFLSMSYPLVSRSGKRWSGVGVTVMDDRSGGIFSLQEAALSYAINVPISRYESLSLGFRGLYQQRRIDLGGLFTGSQYVTDRGFDPSIFNGENLGVLRSDFFTFSSGLSWQQVDRSGVRLAYWSLSLFDFNKPEDSFVGTNDRLNPTFVAAGGFRIYKLGNMSFFPEGLYTRTSANNVVNLGMITRCDVNVPNQKPFHVDVITKYVVKRSGIVGMQFHRENFSVGFSYDFLIHRDNVANTGAMEIGIEVRKLVNPNPKERAARNKKKAVTQTERKTTVSQTVKKTPVTAKNTKQDSLSSKAKPTLAERLEHKKDSVLANARAGKVSHLPFEIEKVILHFNFEFGSSDLDEESTRYLDDLMQALKENPHLRVKLTGHTDNIGSASFNMKLSVYRANTIRDYLISRGIEGTRILADGKGLTEPMNSNKTEAERAKNRRVELTILYAE